MASTEQQQAEMATDPQVFELRCGVQQYDWGKMGLDSKVAALKASADPDFRVDPSKMYAELWMGTHPNCPSMVLRPGYEMKPLLDWVRENPASLGPKVLSYFKGSLPFLFKVLSVRTSLSIQAHPHKSLAESLHSQFPDLYKDPNHKPEIAIALSPFMGLCGFRPIKEVADYLHDIEELRIAVGPKNAVELITASRTMDMPLQRQAMKKCFKGLMENKRDTVKHQLNNLVQRIHDKKERQDCLKSVEGEVIMKLDREFPGDPGAFCVYFLNVLHLQPGEAMFLGANKPHAYLSGDCMECMACSDNVVRAGLTHKYIDEHTLIEMLDYTGHSINHTKFLGIEDTQDITTTIFHPDVPDFGVTRYLIPSNVKEFVISGLETASICIVIEGQGLALNGTMQKPLELRPGSVFFMSAMQDVDVKVTRQEGMLVFRAYAGLLS